LVTIPNYKIVEASIENISSEHARRVLMNIGLTYDTAPEKMEEAIVILKNMPKVFKDVDSKELVAVFSNFAPYSLEIKFIYWIKKSGDVMEIPSKVNFEILKQFNIAGLNFAYPTQTVILNNEK